MMLSLSRSKVSNDKPKAQITAQQHQAEEQISETETAQLLKPAQQKQTIVIEESQAQPNDTTANFQLNTTFRQRLLTDPSFDVFHERPTFEADPLPQPQHCSLLSDTSMIADHTSDSSDELFGSYSNRPLSPLPVAESYFEEWTMQPQFCNIQRVTNTTMVSAPCDLATTPSVIHATPQAPPLAAPPAPPPPPQEQRTCPVCMTMFDPYMTLQAINSHIDDCLTAAAIIGDDFS